MTNLEYLRRIAAMSQMDLAVRLQCHASLVSKLERGWQAKVNPQVARRLMRIFGPEWPVNRLLEMHQSHETTVGQPTRPHTDAA
jgi:ribosome-binding protein aMBF1 (putative translation factor)